MVNHKYNQMLKNRCYFQRPHRGGASLVIILVHFGGSASQNFYIDLPFPLAMSLLSMFVLCCYVEFPHWYRIIEIFPHVGYIMPQLDEIIMPPSLSIWVWVQIDHTHSMALFLKSPLLKYLEIISTRKC